MYTYLYYYIITNADDYCNKKENNDVQTLSLRFVRIAEIINEMHIKFIICAENVLLTKEMLGI